LWSMVPMPGEGPGSNAHIWLELAVPLLSFGGALLAILSFNQGLPLDFRYPALGCVLASFDLAYLAWIRPKKDIVALTTPIYSLIFFVVPTEYMSGIVLQLLYAVSLTILLVRLKYRFGKAGTAAHDAKELAEPLRTYVERTRDVWTGTSPEAAHHATVAFVRFAEGEFWETAQRSVTAAGQPEDAGNAPCLTRAFMIVSEHATLLDQSLPRPAAYRTFLPEDSGMLAKPLPPAQDDDAGFYTALDNALLLLFSAAWCASEADRPHLLACQAFAQKLLSS
jgi:hypothetical protein